MKMAYTYWRDDDMWLGYMDKYPNYMTQGETEQELQENLKDIYRELAGGDIPAARRHGEFEVA